MPTSSSAFNPSQLTSNRTSTEVEKRGAATFVFTDAYSGDIGSFDGRPFDVNTVASIAEGLAPTASPLDGDAATKK